jgi:uncharacterized protein (TIGR03083 family)
METDAHLAAVTNENGRFADALRAGPLDAPVPTCPGWDVQRLASHLGSVHRWVIGWIETGEGTRNERGPTGPAIIDWFEEGIPVLVDHLASLDPAAITMSFVGAQPASFWPRRQAHEAAVHRFDAQAARGGGEPIDAALAVDGVDELLEVFVDSRLGRDVMTGAGETLHLHTTDHPGEWFITLTPEGIVWEHSHTKADVAVRGAASDLLLFLWNRVGPDAVEIFGDQAVIDRWRVAVSI